MWKVQTILRMKVRDVEIVDLNSVLAIGGVGDVAADRVMTLAREERVCVSLDTHDRAGMRMRSSHRMTN
jgi:hypothetical protein